VGGGGWGGCWGGGGVGGVLLGGGGGCCGGGGSWKKKEKFFRERGKRGPLKGKKEHQRKTDPEFTIGKDQRRAGNRLCTNVIDHLKRGKKSLSSTGGKADARGGKATLSREWSSREAVNGRDQGEKGEHCDEGNTLFLSGPEGNRVLSNSLNPRVPQR